jgi:hypothetical protein
VVTDYQYMPAVLTPTATQQLAVLTADPDKHDPELQPKLGGGMVIKHNVDQRYATSAVSAYFFRAAADAAEQQLPVQVLSRCACTCLGTATQCSCRSRSTRCPRTARAAAPSARSSPPRQGACPCPAPPRMECIEL